MTGDPTVVERDVNAIDLFWRSSNGVLQHEYTQNGGANWSGAQSLGQSSITAPSATSWGTARVDLVYGAAADKLGHIAFDGSSGTWGTTTEDPAVVLPLVPQFGRMLQRNLLYTAITRAKRLVVLVGSRRAIQTAVENDRVAQRYSGAPERAPASPSAT